MGMVEEREKRARGKQLHGKDKSEEKELDCRNRKEIVEIGKKLRRGKM